MNARAGTALVTIGEERYLVVPEDAPLPTGLEQDLTILQQPIENIYLVSTSVMDPIISIGALDSIALSGTQADGWYLKQAREAMENGRIAYAGRYSTPDYETILNADCGLAIENTMIYHTPEVKEQLERFGIPVLVERSSYEKRSAGADGMGQALRFAARQKEQAEQQFAEAEQRALPHWQSSRPPAKRWRFSPLHRTACHRAQRAMIMLPE